MGRRIGAGEASPEYLAGGLGAISDQSDRLVLLLDLLLDLSRLEAGRLELHPEPCDLTALARDLVEDVGLTSDKHRFWLVAPTRLDGVWDEQRIEQVLRNLLTNAVKYSPSGGTITVTLEGDRVNVVVRVRDEGIGLAPEECTRVFDRFYRASAVRRLEGAGLGLYICQAIVAAHRGRIWAESPGSGSGSTFCFALPRAVPARSGRPGHCR